jgi:H+/Na+-translocating ferredoxin:NAD+ oxidoreductase subunit B
MSDDVFERLAAALDRLPNGFPRTESGVEIRILQKIFSPEEAALAGHLTGDLEPVEAIARRAGSPAKEVSRQLFKLARRGIVWMDKQDGKACFRLAPFVVGIYEAQIELLDHELAHLVEDYFSGGGAQGIMRPQPALHRVVPAHKAVKSEWVLPYDDVRALLLSAKAFGVQSCICRLQQEKLGQRCDFPLDMCLNFSQHERTPRPGDISQAEALAILERSEEVGLVHTVSNVMNGVGYVCNCCACCCGILRGITEWGIENSVASANYYAVIEAQFCAGCGNCIERCPVGAISEGEGASAVDRGRCIGCGLCVTGCPNDVARLERKAQAEIVQPPEDFAAWERARLRGRGLTG